MTVCIFINERDSIRAAEKTKYLGIVIDQHLKWTHHVDYVVTKIRKLVYKFYILRDILNEKLIILIYKALVESLLCYGITVWGEHIKRQLNQSKLFKIIF